ncbi:class I SAM-dependent methyltransferase [Halorhodospira halochloris]|uniref:class I SAM-dependent methyltransferase n=1 Tax=Halorhodospira halochloris TaxID=1052 RepID=UPI001EE83572|nr:class I SAM-dependent methyltransferase [Halorhodospira halochloris]MCG5531213.1 class I SAM-dependent methyltransferase [Halorhodospira halochloris]
MDYYENHLAATDVKACHRLILEIGADLFESSSSVLDYGCGTGVLIELVKAKYPHLEINGSEVSNANIAACLEKGISCQKIDALPSKDKDDDAYDLVICSEVIEHVQSPIEVLEDIARNVKPGGHVIVSVPNAFNIKHRFYYLFGKHLDPNKDPVKRRFPEHIQSLGFGHMEKLMTMAGLEIFREYGYLKPTGRLIKNGFLRSFFSSYVLTIAHRPTASGSADFLSHG